VKRGAWLIGLLAAGALLLVLLAQGTEPAGEERTRGRGHAERAHAVRQGPPAARARSTATALCPHPFVPTEPGLWWRFIRSSDAGELAVELHVDTVEPAGAAVRVDWTARLDGRAVSFSRRCTPGVDAEDPWFGYAPVGPGTAAVSPTTWRFPWELEDGAVFAGSTTMTVSVPLAGVGEVAATTHRRFRVTGREQVETEAGAFDAVRVDFEGSSTSGSLLAQGSGSLWLAAGVGLVRSEERQGDHVVEQRLLAFGRGDRP